MRSSKLKFFAKFIKNPVNIGSVIPSSRFLSNAIKKIVERLEPANIIELGSGTGAITRGIRHKNPSLIELDKDLSGILKTRFPELKVLNICALDAISNIDKETAIVFSIPLINNPLKKKFIDAINKKYLEGKIKWCVIYTYQLGNPLKGVKFEFQKKQRFCFLNIPPAHLWVYK